MEKLKDLNRKIMKNRYGMDIFSRDMLYLNIGIIIINLFLRSKILNIIQSVILVIILYRMFSKKYSKRYNENRLYTNLKYDITKKYKRQIRKIKDFRKYKYFDCPSCNQTLRVPRKHGEITITCSRCKHKFDAKS